MATGLSSFLPCLKNESVVGRKEKERKRKGKEKERKRKGKKKKKKTNTENRHLLPMLLTIKLHPRKKTPKGILLLPRLRYPHSKVALFFFLHLLFLFGKQTRKAGGGICRGFTDLPGICRGFPGDLPICRLRWLFFHSGGFIRFGLLL